MSLKVVRSGVQRHKRFSFGLESYKKMFPFEENCSDNERDNNNGTSRTHVNYPIAITKRSSELENAAARVRASKRKQQFSLRQCKSESNVRRNSEIDKMGSRVSRSRSFDNVDAESVEYKSLMKKSLTNDERSDFDDSEDEYKPLEDESDSESAADEDNCITSAAETVAADISPETGAADGHEAIEKRISESNINNINCIARRGLTSTGNEIQSDLLCKKYSTLPRVKIKKGNVDHDHVARCSVQIENRAHCSKEIMSETQVQSDGNSSTANISTVSAVPNESDKANDLETFRSTTLPKTRSRLSEPFFRVHSLRRAIDSTMPRKQFRISNASEHSAIIIPESIESASGTGKEICLSHNLFYLEALCQTRVA